MDRDFEKYLAQQGQNAGSGILTLSGRRPAASRCEVYSAVDSERDYQDRVWPDQRVHGQQLSIGDSILLIEEYAAKARAAWSKEGYPEVTALDNLRKVAGIAVRAMETHGAPRRKD